MFSIDLRDTIIAFSLLQIGHCFMRMKTGEIMEIVGVEESVIADLHSLLPASKYELIKAETLNQGSSQFKLLLKKIKATTLNQIKPKEKRHGRSRSEHD